jgi:hypothetical protein
MTGNIPTTTTTKIIRSSFPIGDRNAGRRYDQTELHAPVTWLHARRSVSVPFCTYRRHRVFSRSKEIACSDSNRLLAQGVLLELWPNGFEIVKRKA